MSSPSNEASSFPPVVKAHQVYPSEIRLAGEMYCMELYRQWEEAQPEHPPLALAQKHPLRPLSLA